MDTQYRQKFIDITKQKIENDCTYKPRGGYDSTSYENYIYTRCVWMMKYCLDKDFSIIKTIIDFISNKAIYLKKRENKINYSIDMDICRKIFIREHVGAYVTMKKKFIIMECTSFSIGHFILIFSTSDKKHIMVTFNENFVEGDKNIYIWE